MAYQDPVVERLARRQLVQIFSRGRAILWLTR
jgi:hypothetical protein